MVRTRRKKDISKLKPLNATATSSGGPQPSTTALFEKAQILVAQCNYDLARKFATRVVDRDSLHVEGRELLGVIELEDGNLETAREIFINLIPPSLTAPTSPPPSAYLYLAQLSDADPPGALELYRAGLDIVLERIKNAVASNEEETLKFEWQKMAIRTIIAMVEIWMSDLCFEPQAEDECERLLQVAMELDQRSPELLQTLASVRISQQRLPEAKQLAQSAFTIVRDAQTHAVLLPPPIPSQLGLARIFLELSTYDPAMEILNWVLLADDEDVEAWYLRGWCLILISRAHVVSPELDEMTKDDQRQQARNCLEICVQFHESSDHPDIQIVEHAKELIRELEGLGVRANLNSEEADESGAPGDWEDTEDEDVEMA